MQTDMPTVYVEPIHGRNAVRMVWAKDPSGADVYRAFKDITAYIKTSVAPVYILVDITCKPRFPMNETIRGAINGPFRNPQVAEWLVVGTTPQARAIARTLTGVTRRENIQWFHTEDAALTYLIRVDGVKTRRLDLNPDDYRPR